MLRALELAQMGKFYASPNPRVGAVIVHNNKIIGEGFHQKYGEPHAEVNAINSVKNKQLLSESTIYVTLEPCSHFGKTPPCADLIIKHQLKRVVICNIDPFEKVDGSGIKKLKTAGIDVEINCLKSEGLEVNKRFFTFHLKKRPYVILKWAESKDGYLAKNDNQQTWITNSVSKQLVHLWRAEESAILIGKNTAEIDNPTLTTREVEGKNPVRLIIDENLQLPKSLKIFNSEAKTIVLNSLQTKQDGHLHFIQADCRSQLTQSIMNVCYKNNLQSIIIEGGASILKQFIEHNCWDEARVFTGQPTFKNGLLAPKLNLAPHKSKLIQQDQLHYYKNLTA